MNDGTPVPELAVGDRIELVEMMDPDAIPAGSTGTIENIVSVPPTVQLWVKWDNGRSLMPVCPPDIVRKI